ncbi:hypothetical protein C8R47DRAFT_1230645 [Mycena vitilis]|nr:hypothetical protein C8R47DRAFT_1230645 [Mycena vitilis]
MTHSRSPVVQPSFVLPQFHLAALMVVPFVVSQPLRLPRALKKPQPQQRRLRLPPPPTRAPAGAGLPAPLVALLRDNEGPFVANEGVLRDSH